MNTRLLMSLSAVFLGLVGGAATFMPQELAAHHGAPANSQLVLVFQIAGAAYLGFAILNWMARDVLIGGIYSRPLALGNFLHFSVVAITLLRVMAGGVWSHSTVIATLIYAVFAVWFGLVLFTHPSPKA